MLKEISIIVTHELYSKCKERVITKKNFQTTSDVDLDEAMLLKSKSYFP